MGEGRYRDWIQGEGWSMKEHEVVWGWHNQHYFGSL